MRAGTELGEWVVQVAEGVLYVHPTPSQVFGRAAFATVNVQEQRPKTDREGGGDTELQKT